MNVDPHGVVVAADSSNSVWEMWMVEGDSAEQGAVAVRQVAQVRLDLDIIDLHLCGR